MVAGLSKKGILLALPNALAPAAAATVPGQVDFSWTDNTGVGKAQATD